MLDNALKADIQQAYRNVVEQLALTPRYGQRLMIAEIARTLGDIQCDSDGKRTSDSHVCVLEAGTGTGKTLAYLIAGLPIAKAKGKRLIVSTATVALQEQVLHQDLPSLAQHSGIAFRYALAKGRGRYVCVARLDQALAAAYPWYPAPGAAGELEAGDAAADAEVLPVDAHRTAVLPLLTALLTAMVMPRSLNEPVGLRPSTLRYTSQPVSSDRYGAGTSGVAPSRRVTTFQSSPTGSRER